MKYITIFLSILFILLAFQNVGAETLEFSVPYKNVDDIIIQTLKFTRGGYKNCLWSYYEGDLCTFWGITYVDIYIPDQVNSSKFLSVDLYARMQAGPLWQRLGFGFGFFDRKTESIRTAWDFHLSWQTGIMIFNNVVFHVGFDHWSNARSFA